MIDTDKMRAAYAATPLCQHTFAKKDGANPTMLCAVSALAAFAGVQPDLILKMQVNLATQAWVERFIAPILEAEYGIPEGITEDMPMLFDEEPNEWAGVLRVLNRCERHNRGELHAEAITEDATRFPQHGPEEMVAGYVWMPIGAADISSSSFVYYASDLSMSITALNGVGTLL